MKSGLFLSAVMLFSSTVFAKAEPVEIDALMLPTNTQYLGDVGAGYIVSEKRLGIVYCVDGEVADEVISVPTVPFERAVIVTHEEDPEVREGVVVVRFYAFSTLRKVTSLSGPQKRIHKGAQACGTRVISEMVQAGGFWVGFTFEPKSGVDLETLKLHLKHNANFNNMPYFIKNSPAAEATGVSWTSPTDNITVFTKEAHQCGVWGDRDCSALVNKANQLARQLDQVFTEDVVRKIDHNQLVLSYTHQPY